MIDASVVVWDLEKGKEIAKLVGHTGPVWSVTFMREGQTLASRDNAGNLIIWTLSSPSALASRLTNSAKSVRSLAFSHDGLKLAAGSRDQGVILWDLLNRTRTPERFFTGQVEDVAFSPNKPLLAASMNDAVRLWDFAHHRVRGYFIHKPYMPGRLEFFPDGNTLAVGSSGITLEPGSSPFPILDEGIMLFDTNTSRLIRLLPVRSHGINGLRLKGRTLIAGGASSITRFPDPLPMGRVFLWNVDTGRAIASKMILNKQIDDIAISNDGRLLATATMNSIYLWDLQSQSMLGSMLGEDKDYVSSIEFSPDGRILASGGDFEGHVDLWDVRTHQVLCKLPGHSDYVSRVTWSGDGKILASSANDGSVILWDMEPEDWIRRACGMVKRNLTKDEWTLYLGNERYRKTCGPLERMLK
jgi:WD40 repeat protein